MIKDALRDAEHRMKGAIAALEARYREATGVATLRIRHNAVLGYHIEVSAKHADRLMTPDSGFAHRQTLVGVVRFNSPDLHAEASRVVEAGAHALAAESAVTRQNQSFGGNVLQRAPDEVGHLLGALHLQVAVIDDADGDLLVGDLAADQLEIHAVARAAFERDDVDIELVQMRQRVFV